MSSRFLLRWLGCILLAGLVGCSRADPVEAALKKLKDSAAGSRRQAIGTLRLQHDARAVESLIACLDDGDTDVRTAAADALGDLGDDRAIEPLITHLPPADPESRKTIIAALEKLNKARAADRLVFHLQEKNTDVKMTTAAIEALGALRDPRAVDALISRLADGNEEISDAATEALGRIGAPAVKPLIACLNDSKPGVPGRAAQALGQIGDPRAVQPLIDCLKHPPEEIPSPPDNAADDKKSDDSQMDNGQTDSPGEDLQLRQKVAEALGKLGTPAVDPLISCLQEQDPAVCSLAATALGRTHDPRAIKPLIAGMVKLAGQDPTETENYEGVNIHQSLLDALANMGEPAIKPLAACLKDKDVNVRRDAADVLDQLHYQPAKTEEKIAFLILRQSWDQLIRLGAPAVAPLMDCLKDEDASQRQGAADALGQLNDKRAVEPLIARLQDDDLEVRRSATTALARLGDKRAVAPLIRVLDSDDAQVGTAAAEALGSLGDDRAVAPLVGGLKNEEAGFRQACAQALDKLHYRPQQTTDTITYLIALQSWDKVAKMGPSAFVPLTACLSDQDSDVRQGAVEALGNLGDKRAIKPLSQALPDWDLNTSLVSSLGQLGWKPSSDAEQVYVWIAQKDSTHLKKEWEKTRQVLLDDASSGDSRRVRNAIYSFVALGEPKILDDLVRILNDQGNQEMAETYLNCGNDQLEKAAQDWATQNGYSVLHLPVSGGNHASWGSW